MSLLSPEITVRLQASYFDREPDVGEIATELRARSNGFDPTEWATGDVHKS
jgi:hypothetical protein